jgi:hypothetical protein
MPLILVWPYCPVTSTVGSRTLTLTHGPQDAPGDIAGTCVTLSSWQGKVKFSPVSVFQTLSIGRVHSKWELFPVSVSDTLYRVTLSAEVAPPPIFPGDHGHHRDSRPLSAQGGEGAEAGHRCEELLEKNIYAHSEELFCEGDCQQSWRSFCNRDQWQLWRSYCQGSGMATNAPPQSHEICGVHLSPATNPRRGGASGCVSIPVTSQQRGTGSYMKSTSYSYWE